MSLKIKQYFFISPFCWITKNYDMIIDYTKILNTTKKIKLCRYYSFSVSCKGNLIFSLKSKIYPIFTKFVGLTNHSLTS